MNLSGLNAEYLRKLFHKMQNMKNKQARGREFEKFLERLFSSSGLLCKRDVRSERKEQIDLIVRWGQFLALVEAKWQDKPVSITDLQTFQGRLRKRGNMTIGIFISINGFSDQALEEAKDQDTSLLLLDGSDLIALLEIDSKKTVGKTEDQLAGDLDRLLWKKLWDIQARKIIFCKDGQSRTLNPNPFENLEIPIDLIPENERWALGNDKAIKFTYNQGHGVGGALIFTDIYLHSQNYTIFHILKEVGDRSVETLNRVTRCFNDIFGFSCEGCYDISQKTIGWHGYGIESFIKDLKNQKERYEKMDDTQIRDSHHSENLVFLNPLYMNSFFIFQIYSYVWDICKDSVLSRMGGKFRDFDIHFAIINEQVGKLGEDKEEYDTSSYITKRIDAFCDICGFEYRKTKKVINAKELNFIVDPLDPLEAACAKKENYFPPVLIIPIDYIKIEFAPPFGRTKEGKAWTWGVIFQNPFKTNKKLEVQIKRMLDLDVSTDLAYAGIGIRLLLKKDLWIGFLKDKAGFPLEKKLYLSSIRSIYYNFNGSDVVIVNIQVNW